MENLIANTKKVHFANSRLIILFYSCIINVSFMYNPYRQNDEKIKVKIIIKYA